MLFLLIIEKQKISILNNQNGRGVQRTVKPTVFFIRHINALISETPHKGVYFGLNVSLKHRNRIGYIFIVA